MKLFLYVVLLLPILTFAQSKKDNRIIVTPNDTTNIFNQVVKLLYDKGYTFERKDIEGGMVLTDERMMPDRSPVYKIRALVRDGKVIFTSTLNLRIDFANDHTEVFWTKGDSFYRRIWDIVDGLAKELGTVNYSRG